MFHDPLATYGALRREYGDAVRLPLGSKRSFFMLSRPEHAEHDTGRDHGRDTARQRRQAAYQTANIRLIGAGGRAEVQEGHQQWPGRDQRQRHPGGVHDSAAAAIANARATQLQSDQAVTRRSANPQLRGGWQARVLRYVAPGRLTPEKLATPAPAAVRITLPA
jgi:hypothetical protein